MLPQAEAAKRRREGQARRALRRVTEGRAQATALATGLRTSLVVTRAIEAVHNLSWDAATCPRRPLVY